MSKQLIASKAMSYASKPLVAGDRFEASDQDARVLIAVLAAVEATDEVDDEKADAKGKLSYKRRDLKAEK